MFDSAPDVPILPNLARTETPRKARGDPVERAAPRRRCRAPHRRDRRHARPLRSPAVLGRGDLAQPQGARRPPDRGAPPRALPAAEGAGGGEVRHPGKPPPSIYRACFAALGVADRRRIVAVGDSLRTDIAGAERAGIDSVLVTGGLPAEELGVAAGRSPDPRRLAAACARAGHLPTVAVPAFVW